MSDYLKKYGPLALENGYSICAIRPGEKRPFGKNWEKSYFGPKAIQNAVDKGRSGFGVGVKAKLTPGVDIDCYDPDLVERLKAFTFDLLGPSLERVGQAPKTLLVYRADKPFRKVQSHRYEDDDGRSVKLEVLADGQQFVCFHVHPGTGKPYRWKDKKAPHNTPVISLPTITQKDAQKIADEFDRMAGERGWKRATSGTKLPVAGKELDFDDPFISDKHKVNLSPEDIRSKLQNISDCEDHDTWFQIGMALYHQFDGSDDGLMMWHEWSAQAPNYDSDALDYRWKTFEIEGKKREPITARYILKLAKVEEDRIAGEELERVKQDIRGASDLPAARSAAERIKHIAFDNLVREGLVAALRERIKHISGTGMSITAVRRMVRYENPEHRNTPPWLEGFVYCQEDETFYSLKTRQNLSHKAFDASFARYMMTKRDRLEGNTVPEHSASHVALNRFQIPVVANRMYLPGEDDIFNFNGLDYANMFTDIGIPAVPEKFSAQEHKAIERVEYHFEHLIPHEGDRTLLLDFFTYIVQTGKRVNWAPVIQGVQGDGKTWFYLLMGSVIGAENVNMVPGEALAERNTKWAEGSQFCMIEEIRLHGQERFAVVNKVKPYITNTIVPIRRMRTDWYQVVNTVSYCLLTNFKDGMPIDKSDTRYFPIFSRWQTLHALEAFEKENPDYYTDLYRATDHAGAIRKWFMERKISDKFNPDKRAPPSMAKREMVFLNQSEEDEAFELSLAESKDCYYSPALLTSALMEDRMAEHGSPAPYGRLQKQFLSEAGFTYLGRYMIMGERQRWWSQTPSLFQDERHQIDPQRIKDFIKGRLGPREDI